MPLPAQLIFSLGLVVADCAGLKGAAGTAGGKGTNGTVSAGGYGGYAGTRLRGFRFVPVATKPVKLCWYVCSNPSDRSAKAFIVGQAAGQLSWLQQQMALHPYLDGPAAADGAGAAQ
jgi:hypothetical protein